MLNLYEGLALDGLEIQNTVFQKCGDEDQILEGMFLQFPDLNSDVSIEDCLLSPIAITGKVSVCNTFMLSLDAGIEYKISGKYVTTDANAKIYLSESRSDKTLKESIIQTLGYTDLDENGNFSFPGTYIYNNNVTLIAWVVIVLDPSELGKFQAVATALTSSRNFIYEVRDIEMPEVIDSGAITVDETSTYRVITEGRINLDLDDSIAINLATLYFNGEIPESYYQPLDNNYTLDDKDKLQDNVNKGIYELQQGIIKPSSEDINFQIFMSSLSTIKGTSQTIYAGDNTYKMITDWGKVRESNRIIVWISSNNSLKGNFTIEDAEDPIDSDGEQDGISWEKTCLSGDTLITLPDGTQKRMDALKVGDKVLAKDGKSDIIYEFRRGIYSPYHTLYYFDNGTVIDETHDHRFYNKTQGFWQRLKQWNIGDLAIDEKGKEISLIKKERIDEEVENFGIFTYSGTYYANGLLSGAASCNRAIIANATIEQAIDMMSSIDEKDLLKLFGLEKEII